MEMARRHPRFLDHVVLPVPDLEIARDRLTDLGFQVAPDARHSFGSENACVFFENGTFIEPLAIGQRETVEAHIKKGNNFLRRDAAYRFRRGENGFSCVVLGDPDPKTSRKELKKRGYETGKLVSVKRPGVNVRIAFAIDGRAPDYTMFLCERPDGPPKFADELTDHENGALGISAVYLHEQLPEDFQYYLQTVTQQREMRSHSFGMDFELPNCRLSVLNKSGAKAFLGEDVEALYRGLLAVGFVVRVRDLEKVADILSKNGVTKRKVGNSLIVDPSDGQGAIIVFSEE